MIKKITILSLLSMGAMYYAQDVSLIKNTAEIYSGNNFGGTAKFNSMAGSMGALGGDLSSISVNPAGTGVFITGDLSATLGVQNNKNNSNLFGNSYESSYSKVNLGQIGGVVSFNTYDSSNWKFVNLAFNYSSRSIEDYVRTPGADNIREAISYTGSNSANVNDNLVYSGHAYDRTGIMSNMTIALGGNYDNKFYLGGSLNVKNVDLQQGDFFQLRMQNLGQTAYYDKQYTPYSEIASGVSASVGVIGKLNSSFRVGFALETPTSWLIQRSYTEYGLNNSSSWVSEVFDEERKLTTPMKATFSGAWVASKNFALNVDYTLGLTNPKYKVYGDAERQLNSFFSSNYNRASELRIGGEYRLNGLSLRAGYATEQNPMKAESILAFNSSGTAATVNMGSPYIGKRETLAGGVGYDFKSFYVDAGFQSSTATYNNPFFGGDYAVTANNSFTVVPGDGVSNGTSIVSNVENTRTNFFLTVGWKF